VNPTWIALAGAAGAVSRFVVDALIRRRTPASFPWATLAINVTGSLALGIFTGLVIFRGVSSDLTLVLGTGFCGGYTTFSTATFETVRLAERGEWGRAAANGLGTVVLTAGAAAIGLVLVR
jgi:CrcB protein